MSSFWGMLMPGPQGEAMNTVDQSNRHSKLRKASALKTLLAISVLALAAGAQAQTTITAAPVLSNLELGLSGGYSGGGGGQVFVQYNNLSGPIGVRLSAGRSSNNDGFDDSADLSAGLLGTIAQQKASGNITGEKATQQTYGLDATYDLGQALPGVATSLYGGLRYGSFNSTLTYQGGQSSDYASSAFGVGIGSQAEYLLTRNVSVFGDLGVDQYFSGGDITVTSGTSSDTFKPGEGGYTAINNAVNRPGTVFKAMLGVKYSF